MSEELAPIKTYRSVRRTLERRDQAYKKIEPLIGSRLEGEQYAAMLSLLGTVFDKVPIETIDESCRPMIGVNASQQTLLNLVWRLAGSELRLAQRRAVTGWRPLDVPELQAAEIVQVVPISHKESGAYLAFRILAGTAAPRVVETWKSSSWAGYLSRVPKGFGFPSRKMLQRTTHPYEGVQDLGGLRCLVILARAKDGGPTIDKLDFDAETLRYNQSVQKFRRRYDEKYPCPLGLSPEISCSICPAGKKDCLSATHERTYLLDECPSCGNTHAIIDREVSTTECLRCDKKRKDPFHGGS